MRLSDRIRGWVGPAEQVERTPRHVERHAVNHVVLLDGTLSTLRTDFETNVGLTYKLLRDAAPGLHVSLHYEAGIQWPDWKHTMDVIEGRGISRQIRRVYGVLATRWRPGDRVFLFGYSRGAYAVRSLAGMIDMIGLLRTEEANERNVTQAFHHYEGDPASDAAREFAAAHCHSDGVSIDMVGVWDTVKSLGLRAPVVWRWTEAPHQFHNHHLGGSIRRGYHALARHEKRVAYAPVMWTRPEGWPGEMEQVWFDGCHGDIGGQLGGYLAARPRSNLALAWMLGRAEMAGLTLPSYWRQRFPTDMSAPRVGMNRGWGKLFLARRAREIGRDPSERIFDPEKDLVEQPEALSGVRSPS